MILAVLRDINRNFNAKIINNLLTSSLQIFVNNGNTDGSILLINCRKSDEKVVFSYSSSDVLNLSFNYNCLISSATSTIPNNFKKTSNIQCKNEFIQLNASNIGVTSTYYLKICSGGKIQF